VRHYIPDVILDDYCGAAQRHLDRVRSVKGYTMMMPVHANVLLALIETYREAREQHLQKSSR
jgi:hypothetical protein